MIIVTGANGFIGSAIVWELNQRGITDIVCTDTVRPSERPLPLSKRKYSKFLHTDEVWDFLKLPETQQKVTWIIHMGACSSTTETNADYLWENNTHYTIRLFQWCTEFNKKFIYASSAATYGAGELGFSDTTDSEKLNPLNLYGHSKVAFDRWAMVQTQTPPKWYGLKFFNVYGPNEYHKEGMTSVAFKAFHQIKEKGFLNLFRSHHPHYEDGKQKRDFVYVKDVTSWICELMDKQPKSDIYNMGFGEARTWLDLAGGVFSALQLKMNIEWMDIPLNIRNQYQYFTEADMNKWKSQGMSAPKWSVEDGVKDYVTNYLTKEDKFL
jgi:ADP-L-glycero-D-manno-heptose 6-epimerase